MSIKNKTMTVNGLGVRFNMPAAVKPRIINGKEVPSGLPPHAPVTPYAVDEYPACPTDWMPGSSKAGSFFVGVQEGKGVWLDFNDCASHTHHVAAIVSVQGVNPITGMKQDKMQLEQYADKCPKHDEPFKSDRFCEKCGYSWPAQNYITTAATPQPYFWLDGFRNAVGQVKQYIVTAEESKGVAAQILKKDRVFAIGIAFFLSKEAKPQPKREKSALRGISQTKTCCLATMDVDDSKPIGSGQFKSMNDGSGSGGGTWISGEDTGAMGASMMDSSSIEDNAVWADQKKSFETLQQMGKISTQCSAKLDQGEASPDSLTSRIKATFSLPHSTDPMFFSPIHTPKNWKIKARTNDLPEVVTEKQWTAASAAPIQEIKLTKNLEIGHGSALEQDIYEDTNDLSFYRDEVESFIYINYCSLEDLERILAAGKRDEKKDGFLAEIVPAL
jgi:hypothetical protein